MSQLKNNLTLDDIIAASERVSPFIHKTQVVTNQHLNDWLNCNVYFKLECQQKIGAFKARGALNTLAWLIENNKKPQHVIANSSGNHAQAVAWAASQFDIPATIFMPKNVSKIKAQATAAYGAKIVFCENRMEADANVKLAAEEQGTYWIPPYDHEQVICGQGTAAYEALRQVDGIDAVFAPCGGGGLLSGTFIASKGGDANIKVIGAEPLNANDAAISLKEGDIHKLTSPPKTLADGAMTLNVGEHTFHYLKQLDAFYEVNETDIAYWTQWLSHLLKVRIEATSAMSMSAVTSWLRENNYQTADNLERKNVMVIVSGGNIDQQSELKIWQHNHLDILPSC